MNYKVICFEEIDSTNDYLKKNHHIFSEGTVIWTRYQTKGHGRRGRSWIDKPGENLTFSLLLKPKFKRANLSSITLVTCVSVFEVLKDLTASLVIKWPNDLLVNNLKLSGILSETVFLGNSLEALIIGIGINVNTKEFSNDLNLKTTSLLLETDKTFDIQKLLYDILDNFNKRYQQFLEGDRDYLDVYKRNCPYIGKEVEVIKNAKVLKVLIKDVLENGNILVQDNQETYELSSGEISVKR